MAKQIKRTDIVEDDIFKVTRESAEATLVSINKLNDELKQSAKILSEDLNKALTSTSQGINSFVKASQQANKLKTDSVKLDEQEIKVRQQLAKLAELEEKQRLQKEKADGQAITNAQKIQREQERQAKALERQQKAAKDADSAYKQLERNTRELKNQSKELASQMLILEKSGKRGSKEWRDLAAKYNEVTKAAQKGDAALKKIDSTVGDNFRNVGNYKDAIGGLKGVLGQLGLAFGIGTIISDAGKSVIEFDQKIADLVSITGASGDSLELFKEQSIELGKQVQGGASAVVEAYKLIGSAKPELLENAAALNEVTKSAILLSQASGMELPDAATALTDALNQFGAPAEKAGEFINVLANGALFGSAEIPQVTEALLKFGAVANTANVSVEESTALIEALAEKGLKGAEAGTALRNVMLKLSAPDALPKEAKDRLEALGISFADLEDTSKPFAERLKALKPLLNDNAALVKVFGTENAVAATNLIRNTDRIQQLNKDMLTQGTVQKQAAERTKTLSFVLNQLKETWNGLILSFTEGSGATSILTSGLSFLAENLGSILSIILKGAAAFAIYRTALFSIDIFKRTKEFIEFGKALIKGKAGLDSASDSIKNMGKAFKSIGWTAIIAGVIELATALYDVATGADTASAKIKALETTRKTIAAQNNKVIGQLEREIDAEKNRIKWLLTKGKITKEQADKEYKNFLLKKQYVGTESDYITRTDKDIYANKFDLLRQEKFNIENSIKLKENEIRILKSQGEFKNRLKISEREGEIQALKEGKSEINKYLVTLQNELNETNLIIAADEQDTKGKIDKKDKVKQLNLVMDEYNAYLSEQIALLNELDQVQTEQNITELTNSINDMIEEMGSIAEVGGDVNTKAIEEKMKERYDLEIDLIDKKLQAELNAIDIKYAAESKKAKEQIDENYKKLIGQTGLTAEQRKKIDEQYKEQIDKFNQDEVERAKDKDTKILIEKEKSNNEKLAKDKEYNDEVLDLKNDLNDKLLSAEQDRIDRENDQKQKDLEKEKQRAEDKMAIVQAITDYAIEQSNKRIAQIEKEQQAAENQVEYLKQLAVNGNINAKESLAEQNKIIAEAERQKQQELKRQERIQFANTVYQTYQKNASDDSVKNPLAKTITDVTLLTQFIKTFPAFLEGTEDTGTNGQGIDGKGGFHAILHPNERVLTKEQNALVGNLSNEDLAKIANDYNTGRIIAKGENAQQIGGAWQASAIVKKLDELSKVIEQKPEVNIELGQIIDGAMTIIKSQKKGNSVVYNRYKIK